MSANLTQPVKVFLARMGDAPPSEPFRQAGPGFVFVSCIEDADFVLVPYGTRRLTPRFVEHVQRTVCEAKKYGVEVVVIVSGDLGHRIHLENVLVFKVSAYRHSKRQNEIVSVSRTEDFWKNTTYVPRGKSPRPSVSFCGYAGFPSIVTRIKYLIRNAACDVAAVCSREPHWRAHKRGIYFRRKAIGLLKNDSRLEPRFIIRDAFFLDALREGSDRARARQEFIDNMRNADFVLAPKGDGNYSIRFFEALSMGRIPILIDTDMVLPLEKMIDYSKFILRVPHTEIHTLPDRIVDLYNSLSDEEFQNMQRAARGAYVKYLNQGAFYNAAFPLLKERGSEAL